MFAVDRADSLTGIVDELIARGVDIRIALWLCIAYIRDNDLHVSSVIDSIELRAQRFESYEDMKIYLNDMKKKQQKDNPFQAFFGGGE